MDWGTFFKNNKTNLPKKIIQNLQDGPLNSKMFVALDKELAYEYLEKAGLDDKFIKNSVLICARNSLQRMVGLKNDILRIYGTMVDFHYSCFFYEDITDLKNPGLAIEIPEDEITDEKKSILLELFDGKETWRNWHYPSIVTRIAVNERIKSDANVYFREKFDARRIEFNYAKAFDFGVLATIDMPNNHIERYFIRPHQNRSKIIENDTNPIFGGELVLYKWLELMGIGANVEFFFGGYDSELLICSKDAGVDFLTFEELINQPCFENDVETNPEYKEGLILLHLIWKLFCLRDLSESPDSFGFIGTQLKIINFHVIPKYMESDVIKLVTSPKPPKSIISRQTKAIGSNERFCIGSAVFSKLLANDMAEKLEHAYSLYENFLRANHNNQNCNYFKDAPEYLDVVKKI